MQDETLWQIASIVQQTAGGGDLASLDRSTVLEDIGINSMKRIRIIGQIEKTFGIEFDADELVGGRLDTLGGLCDCVADKVAPRGAGGGV
ncbi:MAG TPA: acyl carrier protein [Polyangiaceae bacterium]|nr:acyl carrier protein [Polyangiaceae bacterium]